MSSIIQHPVDRTESVQITDRGYVPNIIKDSQNRIHYAFGQLVVNGSIGTKTQEKVRKILKPFYIEGDEACHIIPISWGGSGFHVDNFYTGSANMNRGMENKMEDALTNYDKIEFSVEFFYEGNSKRPVRMSYIRTIYKNENGNYIKGPEETGTDENFPNSMSRMVGPRDL